MRGWFSLTERKCEMLFVFLYLKIKQSTVFYEQGVKDKTNIDIDSHISVKHAIRQTY